MGHWGPELADGEGVGQWELWEQRMWVLWGQGLQRGRPWGSGGQGCRGAGRGSIGAKGAERWGVGQWGPGEQRVWGQWDQGLQRGRAQGSGALGVEGVGAVGPEGQAMGQWDNKGAHLPPAMTEGEFGDAVRGREDGGSGAVAYGAQHWAVPPRLSPSPGDEDRDKLVPPGPAARWLFRCPRSCPSLRPRGPATALPPTLPGLRPAKAPPRRGHGQGQAPASSACH